MIQPLAGITKKKKLMNLGIGSVLANRTTKDNKTNSPSPLALIDVSLRVMHEKGEKRDKDCTCDSRFMRDAIHEVGKSIRDTFHFIPDVTPIHLQMDNASEH